MKQRRWYNILNLFSRSSQEVQDTIVSGISYETLEELTEVCEILDDFDQSLVNSIDKEQVDGIVRNLTSGIICRTITGQEATLDRKCENIQDEYLKGLFKHIHSEIYESGTMLVSQISNVYEFRLQIDNDKPLKDINKAVDVLNVDYIDFTIDFKNDRGKIYMGCPDDYYSRSDPIYNKKKPTVIFTMREMDFF